MCDGACLNNCFMDILLKERERGKKRREKKREKKKGKI